jgi:signal transduction histidine kinase
MPTPGRSDARRRTVLPPLAHDAAAALLRPPRLPARVVDEELPLACAAATTATPVLLAMPASAGRLAVARALHALGGRQGPLVAIARCRPCLDDLPPGASVYLDVGGLAPEAVLALEAMIEDGAVWLLAGAEPGTVLPGPLAGRLGAVVVSVPPLAARGAELPDLAGVLLDRLATRRGRPAPTLAAGALARLAAHAWPGDVAELEAVLARALLACDGERIEAAHLRLADGATVVPPASDDTPVAAPSISEADVEFILAELAHEIRNPLVTVKTFAQHLPALLEDAELRARFAALTEDAIGRIDGLLENVLAFARLGRPHRRAVEVGPLVEGLLADLAPELAGRAVRVRQVAPANARCAADPEHLTYALRNVFAGVVREVPAREELVLDAAANGVVSLRFTAGAGAAERLRRLVGGDDGAEASTLSDPTLLPLAFRLARTVLAWNGGGLQVVPEAGEATTVVVRLPTAP